MGWWGHKPYDNDTTSDAWSEAERKVNAVAEKMFREERGDPHGLYSAVGFVILMVDGGIRVNQDVYYRTIEALELIEESDFIESFRSPAAAKREFQATKRKIAALEKDY
jgi:hypothetical protein